jgi:hypothetical protein
MSMDVSKVLDGLNLADKLTKEGAIKGMGASMLQLKNDMIMQAPVAPLDEGFLRGSTSVYVQGREIDAPSLPGEKSGKKAEGFRPKVGSGVQGFIGVNVPYAARLHEVPFTPGGKNRPTRKGPVPAPNSGPKYLESKMVNNKNTYMRIISNAIQRALGGGKKA